MPLIVRSIFFGFLLANATSTGRAQSHSGSHYGGSHTSGLIPFTPLDQGLGHGPRNIHNPSGVFGVASGGYFGAYPPYLLGGPSIPLPIAGLSLNPFSALVPAGQEGPGGLLLSQRVAAPSAPPPPPTRKRTNPNRSDELIEVGDRSFRGGNYRRAEDRYHLAAKANEESPWPHIRLSQIAVVRGDYNKAAGHLRDAVASTKGAGWLLEAPDIQSLFAEPGDFSKQIAHLESHLQVHPDDRNGWFVLGAENYLSGRPRIASDAFSRLTDKSPDEALTAFLDASNVANRPPANLNAAN